MAPPPGALPRARKRHTRCTLVALVAAFAIVTSLATPVAAESNSAEQMSLGQVLQVAVRQNRDLERARIDADIADHQVLQAIGIEDWLLAATGAYRRRRDKPVTGNVTGTNKLDVFSLDASLSRLIASGGTVSFNATGNRTETVFGLVGTEAVQYQSNITVGINQPILRGFGKTVTRAPRSQAEYQREAARLSEELAARTAVQNVVQAYWELALAIRDREIRQSSLALAKEQLRITRAGIRLGRVAATEATAVEQIIATREEEILTSGLAISERSLSLRNQVGLEIGPGHIDVAIKTPLAPKPRKLDLDDLLGRALANSPELAAIRAQGEGAKLSVEVTDNGMLPRLDLAVNGGPLGTAADVGDSLSSLTRFKGYTFNASISVETALERSDAKGSHRVARENYRRLEVDRRDLEAQVAVAVVRATRAAEIAEKRIDISKRAIRLAKQNIEAEQGRFELGRSTNFDVLQRQEELKQAQLRLARAQVDYLSAVAILDALTGDILSRYGIKIDAGQ